MTVATTQASARSTAISAIGKYRYHLRRKIAEAGPLATSIMLNPGEADGEVDDPTIRKCMGFCRRWDVGQLDVVNLLAVRATQPTEIGKSLEPVGPDNRVWIERSVAGADIVVCAWGTHGGYVRQDDKVLGWIEGACKPMCLGVTKRSIRYMCHTRRR